MATIHQRGKHQFEEHQHLEEHRWLEPELGLQQLQRPEHRSQQHRQMEAGFQGHLCLAENRSLLIYSFVRFGDALGSQWMGEETESKGAMDGHGYESKWAVEEED